MLTFKVTTVGASEGGCRCQCDGSPSLRSVRYAHELMDAVHIVRTAHATRSQGEVSLYRCSRLPEKSKTYV